MIPDPWEFILLALAAYRLWRLLAVDEVLDWPRRRILHLGDWEKEGDRLPDNYRYRLGTFVDCPWCAGAWISLIVYVSWVWLLGDPDTISDLYIGVAVWFALSAAVGLIRRLEVATED